MSNNIMDKLASRARVRVIKPSPGSDDRSKLCGEPLQKGFDEGGNVIEFFEIPAHQADYVNKAFRKYRVTEPFIPGVDEADMNKVLDKPPVEGEFKCPVEGCGKTFATERALNGHKSAHA